jgi:hypothetical protein
METNIFNRSLRGGDGSVVVVSKAHDSAAAAVTLSRAQYFTPGGM